jgi:hypothetical protein
MNGLLAALLGVLVTALAGTALVAVRRRDPAAVVNALVALSVSLLSVVAAAGFQLPWQSSSLTLSLPVWVTAAGLLHSVGMLGPYESVWWWDHLTHTLSAALVAALLYAALIVVADGSTTPTLSSSGIAVLTTVATFAAGVFWELVELVARALGEQYGIEPVLVHYGWEDTGYDLLFDTVGAVLIVTLDVRLFVDIAARSPGMTRTLLVSASAVVVGSSVLITLYLGARDRLGTG